MTCQQTPFDDRRFLGRACCRVLLACAGVAAVGQRLEGRDQMVLAIADQVRPAHGLEGFTQQRPVVGIVVAQEGFVQAAAFVAAHDVHGLAVTRDLAQRIAVGVVHRRRRGHR